VRLRVSPNAISLFSIVFAGVACTGFLLSGRTLDTVQRLVWLLVAAAGIQLRLLCNLLDGMVAVEGKMGSKVGEIYNDFPDRVAGFYNWRGRLLFAALALIVIGTIVTMARRTARTARELEAR